MSRFQSLQFKKRVDIFVEDFILSPARLQSRVSKVENVFGKWSGGADEENYQRNKMVLWYEGGSS